jgi:RNA polymerase sigma-70 factor (sigma-E family)
VRPAKPERDASFAEFMDQAGPALLRTAWFLTGDTDHAQELTQAALVKTYVVWHKVDQDRALAYARRCLVNHKIDVWRATRHEVVADLTAPGLETPSASRPRSYGSAEAITGHRDDLVRRLSRLPAQQRKIVVLRYYADQSEAAVAEALGISVGTVKSAASRGLATLRKHAEAEAAAQTQGPVPTTGTTATRHPADRREPAMSTDLESDLRREFDTVRTPGGLMFSPDAVTRTGRRTILRRQIIATGSAAMAVALVATGASLLTRPDDRAAPRPATRTATTGIALGQTAHLWGGQSEVRFNRDPRAQSNVRFSVLGKNGKRHELGVASTGKPGQPPTAVWKSAMVDGHPVTIGLYPGRQVDWLTIAFAKEAQYPIGSEELKGTGFSMFYIDYSVAPHETEATQPSQIASISWAGPDGVVDGTEGAHRLTGRVLNLNKSVSVKVVLRPGDDRRALVSAPAVIQLGGGGSSSAALDFLGGLSKMTVASTDPSGAAVVTGRTPFLQNATIKGVPTAEVHGGGPLAAGVLPPGATAVGVVLTTNEARTGLAVTKRLPDGRVVFALNASFGRSAHPAKDSIKAVTWTNADGTLGRIAVTQKQQ